MAETDGANIVDATKETLTKKVGPAPIWVYAAGGMVLLFLYSRSKRGKVAAASAAAAAEDIPTDAFGGAAFSAMGNVPLAQGYVPSTDETNAEERTIWTNNDWVFQAAKRMAKSHPDDSTNVLRRLRQYVSGGMLAEGEYNATIATAEEAIQLVGPPPEPFVPPSPVPTVQTPAPAPEGHIPPQPSAPVGPTNNGQDIRFTLSDFGGSIESAADYYFADHNAWYRFLVYDPNGDPSTGWINATSYHQLDANTPLVVGPAGRIRD